MFIQGYVISSEYTIIEYIYDITRQRLQQFTSAYLRHIRKILNQYTTILEIL